jgi:hypothetical protein
MEDSKWVLKSRTIWGLILTAVGAFAPVAKAVGFEYPSETEIGMIGETGYQLVSAIATAVGLGLALYGRIKAVAQLWVVTKTDADNA